MLLPKTFKNTLIISPHPDDSEYSCYGLIEQLDHNPTILICSSGGVGDETNMFNRDSEIREFWKNADKDPILHSEQIISNEYSKSVKILDSFIAKGSFDAVFVPPEFDTNQEHRLVSQICKSSLRNKNCALIEYWTPSTTHEWQPNIWLDIEKFFDRKRDNLICSFVSQSSKSYFDADYIDLFHQDWQSFKRGIKKCEKYKIISWMCR